MNHTSPALRAKPDTIQRSGRSSAWITPNCPDQARAASRFVLTLALALVCIGPAISYAAGADNKSASSANPVSAAAEGEVRRIDREGGKLTIRHGPIRNLDVPPMTLVFQVADPAMLDAVKPGDRVTFEATKIGNAYRVTRIVPAPTPR